MIYSALDAKLGYSEEELSSKGYPSRGESAVRGGKYVNRISEYEARPEVDDLLARARLFQRTVEDVKGDSYLGGLPGHPEGLA